MARALPASTALAVELAGGLADCENARPHARCLPTKLTIITVLTNYYNIS